MIEQRCARAGAHLSLTQRRYLPLGSAGSEPRVWQLPVCIQHAAGSGSKRICTLLTSERVELPLGAGCPAWLIAEDLPDTPLKAFAVAP